MTTIIDISFWGFLFFPFAFSIDIVLDFLFWICFSPLYVINIIKLVELFLRLITEFQGWRNHKITHWGLNSLDNVYNVLNSLDMLTLLIWPSSPKFVS